MSPNFDAIKEQAFDLPEDERANLAHELLISLDEKAEDNIGVAWDAEIKRRVEEIKSGKAKGRIAEDVIADIRAKYS